MLRYRGPVITPLKLSRKMRTMRASESLVGVTDLTIKARLVVRHCETGVLRSTPGELSARHGGAGFGEVKLPDG